MLRLRRTTATPQEWTNTRVMDAENFLDIACAAPTTTFVSTSSSIEMPFPADSEGATEVEAPARSADANQDSSSSPRVSSDLLSLLALGCSFFVHVVMHSLVVPFVCTFAIIPLLIPETPHEVCTAYYWTLICGVALYFGENTASRSLGFDMSRRTLVASMFFVSTITSLLMVFVRQSYSYMEGVVGFVGVMFTLYTPVISRVIDLIRRSHPMTPLLWFILYLSWGASPTLISVLMYYGLNALQWKENLLSIAGCVAMWSVAPFFVKSIGWKLVYRGSPQGRFVAPLLWILYCDLAFGTLGLPLFMHSPRASLTYAASVIPVLLLHMARGAGLLSWCCICRDRVSTAAERRVTQLNALLEALCAVQGRAVAYTVYFTMMLLKAAFEAASGEEGTTRYSMIQGRVRVSTGSVQIYRRTSQSALDMLAAFCGLILSWASFCFFCWLLPHAWAKSSRVAPDVSDSSPYAASHATDGGGWILGDRAETLGRQYQVVISFFQRHLHNVVSALAFQLAITVAAVNLAEHIIDLRA
eukprot:TRINITY_DN6698_c0_g1_i4.p1 TRINITY_DN6698_c0_g1~~TRINITY_DN6698_c0_g1_i4.p1  ORF type:complete len:529 (-),score=20.02 TRINITY_DN6698_c0_g1_i4:429-2015(-)